MNTGNALKLDAPAMIIVGRRCSKCGLSEPDTEFYTTAKVKYCKLCHRKNVIEYKRAHVPEYNKYGRESYRKLKEKVFDLLGRSCRRCGFTDWRALQIDHVNGGGSKERRALKDRGTYNRALRHPEEYRTLCANCNWIKRFERGEHT